MDAIVAEGLVKKYVSQGGFLRRRRRVVEALRGVSFKVGKGMIYSLLGPNGAGKTTTVRIITTLLLPDAGDAYVLGHHVVREARSVRSLVGVTLSVEKGFYPRLTGFENLVYFGMLYGLSRGEARSRARELLGTMGLENAGDRLVQGYSLGMRARLSLARALIHDPPVLVLDEPTLGLDPVASRNVRNLIRELSKEGKTVLLTTHNMQEAEMLSDKVGLIKNGVIVAEGSVEELKRGLGKMSVVVLKVEGVEDAGRMVGGLGSYVYERPSPNGYVELRIGVGDGEEAEVLYRAIGVLKERGRVIEARIERPSLEDVFVKYAGESIETG